MAPFHVDPDFQLHLGDARAILPTLPTGSVDCVVTSPPYFGLRDYGTGHWQGGDEGCDHAAARRKTRYDYSLASSPIQDGSRTGTDAMSGMWMPWCPDCGARRIDLQIGLEQSPDEYVAQLVAVFHELQRVLAPHGTVWLNLGDSYASRGGHSGQGATSQRQGRSNVGVQNRGHYATTGDGLKPKDLIGIPWRVAFALQADGWYLRRDIIWAKPNPMPESATDRPTTSHEYVFMLTKQPSYFFDQEAVREPHSPDGRTKTVHDHATLNGHDNHAAMGMGQERWPNSGRNVRSVWTVATESSTDSHFATFPIKLVLRCIQAGCPGWVCRRCGAPRERIVEKATFWEERRENGAGAGNVGIADNYQSNVHGKGMSHDLGGGEIRTVGWSDCGHGDWRRGMVLDPFMGTGTTARVALDLGLQSIGCELSEQHARTAVKRLGQLSLLSLLEV